VEHFVISTVLPPTVNSPVPYTRIKGFDVKSVGLMILPSPVNVTVLSPDVKNLWGLQLQRQGDVASVYQARQKQRHLVSKL